MDAVSANDFIARRTREPSCREALRKYNCEICGMYHVTSSPLEIL
jgi:hypothetical protein